MTDCEHCAGLGYKCYECDQPEDACECDDPNIDVCDQCPDEDED